MESERGQHCTAPRQKPSHTLLVLYPVATSSSSKIHASPSPAACGNYPTVAPALRRTLPTAPWGNSCSHSRDSGGCRPTHPQIQSSASPYPKSPVVTNGAPLLQPKN